MVVLKDYLYSLYLPCTHRYPAVFSLLIDRGDGKNQALGPIIYLRSVWCGLMARYRKPDSDEDPIKW